MIQRDGETWVRHLPNGKWHKLPSEDEVLAILEAWAATRLRKQKEQSDE